METFRLSAANGPREEPLITKRIDDTANTAVRLICYRYDRGCPGGERLLIHRIWIGDVEQERSWHRLAFTELDRAVADPQPRVAQLAALVAPHLFHRAERTLQEFVVLCRAPCMEKRRHRSQCARDRLLAERCGDVPMVAERIGNKAGAL